MKALPKLSPSEVDRIIDDLDSAMDEAARGESALSFAPDYIFSNIVEHCYSAENVDQIWEQFSEYCKQNELDPAQQMREAVISYYQDILRQYKTKIVNGAFE